MNTGAAEGTTRTFSFALQVPAKAALSTSQPGGWVERPLEREYTPTFWPAVEGASVGDWAIVLRQSTGVRMSTAGAVELMAARDARHEQCDEEGGQGSDAGSHRIAWRIERTPGAIDAARAAQAFNRPIDLEPASIVTGATPDLPQEMSLLAIDDGGVVSALKPATQGGGVIVRAVLVDDAATVTLSPLLAGFATRSATDTAERDLRSLSSSGGTVAINAADVRHDRDRAPRAVGFMRRAPA